MVTSDMSRRAWGWPDPANATPDDDTALVDADTAETSNAPGAPGG